MSEAFEYLSPTHHAHQWIKDHGPERNLLGEERAGPPCPMDVAKRRYEGEVFNNRADKKLVDMTDDLDEAFEEATTHPRWHRPDGMTASESKAKWDPWGRGGLRKPHRKGLPRWM